MDNIQTLSLTSPAEIKEGIRDRARCRRLSANLTQQGLADRAHVSLGTLKLFERTGNASIEFLTAIAFALNVEKEFEDLFSPAPYKTIKDVIGERPRLRGRRK